MAASAVAPRRRLSMAALEERVRARLLAQRRLVHALLRLRAQAEGSLFARYGRCGKAGCACGEGRGHGPYHVLSRRRQGRGTFAYLPAERVPEAQALVGAAREFRRGLGRLRKVNDELVVLLRSYQRASARTGERALGLGA